MSGNGKRGRPVGYRLSEHTKEKIRRGRMGKTHSEETKNKIAQSLIDHFKKKDPLSESMEREFKYLSEDACDWVSDKECEINDIDDVLTNKRLIYLNQIELSYGNDIERFCHNATPEFLLILKEDLINMGLKDVLDELESLL